MKGIAYNMDVIRPSMLAIRGEELIVIESTTPAG
jgi:hypothetical protein